MTVDPGNANIPSLTRRVAFASLRLVFLLLFFVAIPLGLLSALAARGIQTPVSLITVSTVGIVLSVLGAAATIARPTRAYGPIALVSAGLFFVYLIDLARNGTVTFSVGSGATFQLSYGSAILLVAVMPILSLVAASLTTLEDARHPGERLPFDYPPKRGRRGA
jgi:hypothetical protein